MDFSFSQDGIHAVGTVLKDNDDPRVNAVTVVNVSENGYDLVERVSPASESDSPMWVRYDVSHDEMAQKEREGLLEASGSLSPDEIKQVRGLATAHPNSVPEMEQSLEI